MMEPVATSQEGLTPAMIFAASAMAVTIIGALAGAVVTIMKGFADMRVQMSRLEGTASDIHAVVNSGASALKEQNERAVVEAVRVATANTIEASRTAKDLSNAAYAQGLAEGQLLAQGAPGVTTVAAVDDQGARSAKDGKK